MRKSAVRGANAIVVSSKLEYEDAVQFGIKPKCIHIIPMGIDLPPLSEKADEDTHPLRLLFVGRIARVRRLEWILQAASRLTCDWSLTIVGGENKTSSLEPGGYLNELKSLASELKLEDRIHWAGQQNPDDLSRYYQNADLFVYPTEYENFGQPLLEAAAHGLPLIASRVGVAAELIREGVTGFFIDDPKSMADSIQKLNAIEERRDFSQATRQTVADNFSWDRVMERYLELYRGLTKS